MVVGIKDALKLIGISVMACCAVFVCTLFLSYNIDIVAIRDAITSEAGIALYDAHVSMGKVICIVTGAGLVANLGSNARFLHKELHRYARQGTWNFEGPRLFQSWHSKTFLGIRVKCFSRLYNRICGGIHLSSQLL